MQKFEKYYNGTWTYAKINKGPFLFYVQDESYIIFLKNPERD